MRFMKYCIKIQDMISEDWVNRSKRGGMNNVFRGLAGFFCDRTPANSSIKALKIALCFGDSPASYLSMDCE